MSRLKPYGALKITYRGNGLWLMRDRTQPRITTEYQLEYIAREAAFHCFMRQRESTRGNMGGWLLANEEHKAIAVSKLTDEEVARCIASGMKGVWSDG
jgi:hypothetical protein